MIRAYYIATDTIDRDPPIHLVKDHNQYRSRLFLDYEGYYLWRGLMIARARGIKGVFNTIDLVGE